MANGKAMAAAWALIMLAGGAMAGISWVVPPEPLDQPCVQDQQAMDLARDQWLAANCLAEAVTDCGGGLTYQVLLHDGQEPACYEVDTYQVLVTDGCGNELRAFALLRRHDTAAPMLTEPGQDVMLAGETCPASQEALEALYQAWRSSHAGAAATDACSGVVDTWTDNAPASLAGACEGTVVVDFKAHDACGYDVLSWRKFVFSCCQHTPASTDEPASPTTASPTSASPTSASPTSASPTSASPTSASPTSPSECPPGYVLEPSSGCCLVLYDVVRLTQANAQAACANDMFLGVPSFLAILNTPELRQAGADLTTSQKAKWVWAHKAQDGAFYWANGDRVSDDAWYPNEPSGQADETCVRYALD